MASASNQDQSEEVENEGDSKSFGSSNAIRKLRVVDLSEPKEIDLSESYSLPC